MKIPSEIRIGGVDYQILRKECITEDTKALDGQINYSTGEILLSGKGNGHQYLCVVLLHEVLHGIAEHTHLHDALGDNTEKIIDVFAYGIYQVLQDNAQKLFDIATVMTIKPEGITITGDVDTGEHKEMLNVSQPGTASMGSLDPLDYFTTGSLTEELKKRGYDVQLKETAPAPPSPCEVCDPKAAPVCTEECQEACPETEKYKPTAVRIDEMVEREVERGGVRPVYEVPRRVIETSVTEELLNTVHKFYPETVCDHKDPNGKSIFWNEGNKAFQCHKCGQVFEPKNKVDENTSDRYHTFKELYEFKKVLNAALFNEWFKNDKYSVCKSKVHSDGERCFGGGWFIVVAELPSGQVSNHYELCDWDLFNIQEKAPAKYDGHTPGDVVRRLKALSRECEDWQRPCFKLSKEENK